MIVWQAPVRAFSVATTENVERNFAFKAAVIGDENIICEREVTGERDALRSNISWQCQKVNRLREIVSESPVA